MSVVSVIAIITTKPGKRDEVLAAARANLATVRAEDGCIEYVPHIDTEGMGSFQTPFGPDTFVFIEKWESKEALGAHAAAPHMKAYAAKVGEMLESRVIHIVSSAE
ncbi:MAG: putative quinol monooxygenase [Alphaproteobacteria bacterium]|jgi:quinol monooxygenase YgiN